MRLMEFAKTMPEKFGEQEFIERVNQVIDLKEIQSLWSRPSSWCKFPDGLRA